MTYGKCGNQNKDLFPISWDENSTQCQDEKNMIVALDVKNMLPAKPEIQLKGIHNWGKELRKK